RGAGAGGSGAPAPGGGPGAPGPRGGGGGGGGRPPASLRAEAVSLLTAGEAASGWFANRAAGTLEEIAYLGADVAYRVRLDDQTLVRVIRRDDAGGERLEALRRGERVWIGWSPGACRIIDRG